MPITKEFVNTMLKKWNNCRRDHRFYLTKTMYHICLAGIPGQFGHRMNTGNLALHLKQTIIIRINLINNCRVVTN